MLLLLFGCCFLAIAKANTEGLRKSSYCQSLNDFVLERPLDHCVLCKLDNKRKLAEIELTGCSNMPDLTVLSPFYDCIDKLKIVSGNFNQIPELICNFGRLETLTIEQSKIEKFPKCVSKIKTFSIRNMNKDIPYVMPELFIKQVPHNTRIVLDGFFKTLPVELLRGDYPNVSGNHLYLDEVTIDHTFVRMTDFLRSVYVKNVNFDNDGLSAFDHFKNNKFVKRISFNNSKRLVCPNLRHYQNVEGMVFQKNSFPLNGKTICNSKLTSLTINSMNVTLSKFKIPSVSILDLTDSDVTGALPEMQNLKELIIDGARLSKETWSSIARLSSLRKIKALGTVLSDDNWAPFKLEELNVGANFLTSSHALNSVVHLLCKVARIESIDLSSNQLVNLPSLPHVKVLTAANNSLVHLPQINYDSLEQLDISSNLFTGFATDEFPSLTALRISDNHKLTALKITAMIQDLDISNTSITKIDGNLDGLVSLNVSHTHLESYEFLSRLKNLKTVGLDGLSATKLPLLFKTQNGGQNLIGTPLAYNEGFDFLCSNQNGCLSLNTQSTTLLVGKELLTKNIQNVLKQTLGLNSSINTKKHSKCMDLNKSHLPDNLVDNSTSSQLSQIVKGHRTSNKEIVPFVCVCQEKQTSNETLRDINELSSLKVLLGNADRKVIGLDTGHDARELIHRSLLNNLNCSSIGLTKSFNEFNSKIALQMSGIHDVKNSFQQSVLNIKEMSRLRNLVIPKNEAEQSEGLNKVSKLNMPKINRSASTLTLSNSDTVPDSVTRQVQLTALILKNVKNIPETITKLVNLETIDFTECPSITEIPRFLLVMNDNLKIKASVQSFKTDKMNELQLFLTNVDAPVKKLDLSNFNAETLPSLASLSALEELVLDNSNVKNINAVLDVKTLKVLSIMHTPDDFVFPSNFWREMQSLDKIITGITHLDLSGELDSYVPKVVKSLQSLTSISVANNPQLKEVSDTLFYLTNLRILNLSNTNVATLKSAASDGSSASFPGIDNLSKLEVIDVTNTPLTELSKELFRIQTLKNIKADDSITSLDLSGILDAKQPPAGLYRLTQLKALNVSSNKLTYMDDSLFLLTNLEVLDYSHNVISSVSQDIDKLAKLKEVDFSSNLLRRLPQELINLSELSKLNVEDNYLTSLPAVSDFQNKEISLFLENNCSVSNKKRKTVGCNAEQRDITKSFSSEKGIIKIGKVACYIILGISVLCGVIFGFYLVSDDTKKEATRLQRQYDAARARALQSEAV